MLTPTWRGENGNPGAFELLYGEVDDLAAAVRTLAVTPGVDGGRVYVFGHSVGGGLSALLALYPDVPLRASGSAGGLFFPTFERWRKSRVRFPLEDRLEQELRVMLPHMDELVRPHIAYMGEQEISAKTFAAIAAQAARVGSRLRLARVRGNHSTALAPAIRHFISIIRKDAFREAN